MSNIINIRVRYFGLLREIRGERRKNACLEGNIEIVDLLEKLGQSGCPNRRSQGGVTKPTEADIKGKIVEYSWWMKKQGYSEYMIRCWASILRSLAGRGANLFDP